MKLLPSKETLETFLHYDPTTGKLFWKERGRHLFATDGAWRAFNSRDAYTEAFTAKTKNGYLHGHIWGEKFYAHRVIWKMLTGKDPNHIDHINHDRTDNREDNLRDTTQPENNRNVRIGTRNTSGVVGVMWDAARGKWRAEIMVGQRTKSLGRFDSFAMAVATRKQAERDLGFHANHGAT